MKNEREANSFGESSWLKLGQACEDIINISNGVEMEEQFLCKGRLRVVESNIRNKELEKRLSREKGLEVSIMRATINSTNIEQQIQNRTDIHILCCNHAHISGENVRIGTSDLKNIKMDKITNRLYLTTRNSQYVFDVQIWAEV